MKATAAVMCRCSSW